MAKSANQKRKLPILAKLLLERSDEENPIPVSEMLAELDCRNIADGGALESLSMEAILKEDPDHIFVVMQTADAQPILESTLLSDPAWQSLTAVQAGRYHVMDPALFNLKPNARWGEAYEILADILYP